MPAAKTCNHSTSVCLKTIYVWRVTLCQLNSEAVRENLHNKTQRRDVQSVQSMHIVPIPSGRLYLCHVFEAWAACWLSSHLIALLVCFSRFHVAQRFWGLHPSPNLQNCHDQNFSSSVRIISKLVQLWEEDKNARRSQTSPLPLSPFFNSAWPAGGDVSMRSTSAAECSKGCAGGESWSAVPEATSGHKHCGSESGTARHPDGLQWLTRCTGQVGFPCHRTLAHLSCNLKLIWNLKPFSPSVKVTGQPVSSKCVCRQNRHNGENVCLHHFI